MGIAFSTVFTSNIGWALLDLVEHYISNYVIVGVGLLQCIAIGWLFEAEETSARS
jgi:NSS family neurotransmitter:Na+ symporter